jgi:S1-C subfamily serine protease
VSARALVLAGALVVAACSPGGGDEESARPAAQAPAATTSAPARDGDVFGRIPEIVERVEPAVVAVAVRGPAGEGTNNHVVAGADAVEVTLASGERLAADVEAADVRTDLAVLRIDRDGLPAARFADALPRVGELAVAVGNPLGFEQTVTAGIVSGLHRSVPAGGQAPALVDLIQTDAPISPGNSGGALVDADAEVIGINVAFIPPEARAVSIGFAIPAPTVVDVVTQLLERGTVEHAVLGVFPAEVTPDLAEAFDLGVDDGVLVRRVERGSGADRAGLEAGDVIVGLDGRNIATVEDLFAELRRRDPGDRVTVTLVRGGEERELEVTLGSAP